MSVWISWPILTVALIIFIVLIIAGIFIVAPESSPPPSAHPEEGIHRAWTLSWVKGDWWKTVCTTVVVVLIVLLCGR